MKKKNVSAFIGLSALGYKQPLGLAGYVLAWTLYHSAICNAQNAYVEDWGTPLAYEDRSYYPSIRTILFHPLNEPLAFPAIALSSSKQLLLRFDDLLAQGNTFSYTLILCNSDWTPSTLSKSEYLIGYQDHRISNVDYSFNTFVPYSHYQLLLPNSEMTFNRSGNYLLVVYEESQAYPVLTRRFVVYEEKVQIGGEVRRPSRVEYRETHQEVDFVVNHGEYDIPDPFNDLHTVLLQNQRWNASIRGLEPRFVQAGHLNYDYDRENLFPGGNEWRNFDTKDERNLSLNVRRIELDTNFTYFIQTQYSRSIERYSTEFDINGQRVIRNTGSSAPNTEADYVWVDIELKIKDAPADRTYYLIGAFNDWRFTSENRMAFDYARGSFRSKLLLKQGYYNYQFAELSEDQGRLDGPEGDHWETENTYQLIIYHRGIGIRYDRVIGFKEFTSEDVY